MLEDGRRSDLGEVLIASAIKLLEADGEGGVSLRAVARHAGVSAMAPYRHYADKEALLAAVATLGFIRLRELMLAADSSAPHGEELVSQCKAYFAFARSNAALFRLMFGPPRSGDHPSLRAAGDAAYGVTAARIKRAFPKRNSQVQTMAIWSLIHGLTMLYLDEQVEDRISGTADDIAERVMHTLVPPPKR